MDPLTAIANMIAAVCSLAETVIKSQPAEVQKQIWEDHMKNMAKLRKFFKISDE